MSSVIEFLRERYGWNTSTDFKKHKSFSKCKHPPYLYTVHQTADHSMITLWSIFIHKKYPTKEVGYKCIITY